MIITFENYNTNTNLIIIDNGDHYLINKIEIEGKLYSIFKLNYKLKKNNNELWINYTYDNLVNHDDVQKALYFLESLPGVETVIHRMGNRFELSFDKVFNFK